MWDWHSGLFTDQKGPSITHSQFGNCDKAASCKCQTKRVPPVATTDRILAFSHSRSFAQVAGAQDKTRGRTALPKPKLKKRVHSAHRQSVRQPVSRQQQQPVFTGSSFIVVALVQCLRTLLFWRNAPERRHPSDPPSAAGRMVQGQLRVAVIGAQTQRDGKKPPYTVYRTVVNFHGQCYQRLIRYREFARFNSKLRLRHMASKNESPAIVFPKKEWTRKLSLEEDVIEARQVLLNEYMNQVTQNELTPGCYDRLLRVLKVGDYDVETKGHPMPHKSPRPSGKGERPTVDVLRDMENEEADDKIEQYRKRQDEEARSRRENGGAPTDRIGAAAMIVNTSAVYRSVTSNAETVLTEDERSMDERREDSGDPLSDDQEDEVYGRESMAPPSAIPNKHLAQAQRSQLRSAMSAPTQRTKKVKFVTVVEENPAAEERHVGDLSPERKYGPKIKKQMSSIDSILSEYNSADGHAIPPEFHSESAILARNRAESL